MKNFNIAALAGDGIGPEVMREAIKVLRVDGKEISISNFTITDAPVGWAGIDFAGKALPDVTLESLQEVRCDPIRLGRFAGP